MPRARLFPTDDAHPSCGTPSVRAAAPAPHLDALPCRKPNSPEEPRRSLRARYCDARRLRYILTFFNKIREVGGAWASEHNQFIRAVAQLVERLVRDDGRTIFSNYSHLL